MNKSNLYCNEISRILNNYKGYLNQQAKASLLDNRKSDAEVYNSAELDLGEIINIMEEATSEDKLVARVHTGDPSIYGAIAEQIRLLNEKNIPFSNEIYISRMA